MIPLCLAMSRSKLPCTSPGHRMGKEKVKLDLNNYPKKAPQKIM